MLDQEAPVPDAPATSNRSERGESSWTEERGWTEERERTEERGWRSEATGRDSGLQVEVDVLGEDDEEDFSPTPRQRSRRSSFGSSSPKVSQLLQSYL